jgi:hypothetical protein
MPSLHRLGRLKSCRRRIETIKPSPGFIRDGSALAVATNRLDGLGAQLAPMSR